MFLYFQTSLGMSMGENSNEPLSEAERSARRRIKNRQSTEFSNEQNNPCSKVRVLSSEMNDPFLLVCFAGT